jgi:hypothetical protein
MKHGAEIFKIKIYEWFYHYLPFDREIVEQVLERYETKELHSCLKYWNSFENYLKLYDIEKIGTELKKLEFTPVAKQICIEVQLNRIIFLSSFIEIASQKNSKVKFRANTRKLIETTIDRFSIEALAEPVTASPSNLKPFAEQMAVVISSTSLIVMREFPRCTGYIIGGLYSEKVPLLDDLDGGSLYTDIVLNFTERLYCHFRLH